MNSTSRRIPGFRRIRILDGFAIAAVAAYLLLAAFYLPLPLALGAGRERVPALTAFRLVVIAAAAYLVIRGLLWARTHWLWSLRNQLIAVYFFLSALPIALLAAITGLALYLLYWHFGAYLLYADLQKRIDQVASTADTVTTAYALELASTGISRPPGPLTEPPPHTSVFLTAAQESLPGLQIEVGSGQELLTRSDDRRRLRFEGLVEDHNTLELRAVIGRRLNGQLLVVSATVPVTPQFVSTLEPRLGPIQIVTARAVQQTPASNAVFLSRGRQLAPVQTVQSETRTIAPRAHWFDYSVSGFKRVDAVNAANPADPNADVPIMLRFTARASQLNALLIALLGEWGGAGVTAIMVVGSVFIFIELAALAGSISLTRAITHAVDDLYQATRYVEARDFAHRIDVRHHDQLGALGASFNSMTASVATLITEQHERQRLEHEIEIAREVQAQLFPKEKPKVAGVEIEAICRPARVVSGDYYDFLPLDGGRVGVALADVSGKGISAALIMASLQAALRGLALADGRGPGSTAEIVARLNQQLFRSTAEDRYATFFYAVYDPKTHRLEYTNAGHPAPICISGDNVLRLSTGGTVLGLFDECKYESQVIEVAPGSLLIAYSDGLTEAEDSQGREMGEQSVLDIAQRMRQASAHEVLGSLMKAVDQWAGPAEQFDDITVIVGRF